MFDWQSRAQKPATDKVMCLLLKSLSELAAEELMGNFRFARIDRRSMLLGNERGVLRDLGEEELLRQIKRRVKRLPRLDTICPFR